MKIELTQEQRKALAEWYFGHKEYDIQEGNLGWVDSDGYLQYKATWQPDKDMNQLKMLMDRFIKEAKIVVFNYNKSIDGSWSFDCYSIGLKEEYFAEGSSISECDLNVLTNYVEGLKK